MRPARFRLAPLSLKSADCSHAGCGKMTEDSPIHDDSTASGKPPIDLVVQFLNATRTRATYGAVAEVIGGIAQGVAARLGEKRPEASWIVNGESGLPTGYAADQLHRCLRERDEIIASGAVLGERLRAWSAERSDPSLLLEKALRVAVLSHAGQSQKDGRPYILHPLALVAAVSSPEAKMVAALHDVVEDTATTLDDLQREGFPEVVVAAVECLTHRDGEAYDAYIDRIAGNALAREVKLADLVDNMDVRRLPELRDRDLERLRKYHRAWKRLSRMPA